MKRERATQLVKQLLQRLDAERHAWPTNLITEVYLFGSFARGAVEPTTSMWRSRWTGTNPQTLIRRALVGNSRSFGFFFDGKARTDFPLTLLWRRGEAISLAAQRLHTLAPDPTVSRAPRDAMLPQFEGLDRWIDRPAREHLTSAVTANAINIERLDLPDATVTDPVAAEYLLDRWNPPSPLYRAGHAVLAYVETKATTPAPSTSTARTSTTVEPALRRLLPALLQSHPMVPHRTRRHRMDRNSAPHPHRNDRSPAHRPLDIGLLDRADWS